MAVMNISKYRKFYAKILSNLLKKMLSI